MIFRNTPDSTPSVVKSVLTMSVGQQIWEECGYSRDKRPRDGMVFGLHSLAVVTKRLLREPLRVHQTHSQLRFSKSCLSTSGLLSGCSRVKKLLALLLALGVCEFVTPSPNSGWSWRRGSESVTSADSVVNKIAGLLGFQEKFSLTQQNCA
jgi:hypothetical protein